MNFLLSYFSKFPDLLVFIAVFIFFILLSAFLKQAKMGLLLITSYFSFAIVSLLPNKDILQKIKISPIFGMESVVFFGLLFVLSLFFIFTGFTISLPQRKGSILKSFILSILLSFLLLSIYFNLERNNYNFSPLMETIFFGKFSNLLWFGIPLLLLPFLL